MFKMAWPFLWTRAVNETRADSGGRLALLSRVY